MKFVKKNAFFSNIFFNISKTSEQTEMWYICDLKTNEIVILLYFSNILGDEDPKI